MKLHKWVFAHGYYWVFLRAQLEEKQNTKRTISLTVSKFIVHEKNLWSNSHKLVSEFLCSHMWCIISLMIHSSISAFQLLGFFFSYCSKLLCGFQAWKLLHILHRHGQWPAFSSIFISWRCVRSQCKGAVSFGKKKIGSTKPHLAQQC